VRVGDRELAHVLDDDEPLADVDLAEHRAQQRRLATARATTDDEGAAPAHQSLEHPEPAGAERPPSSQIGKARGHPARDAQADVRALYGNRREHGVQAHAAGEQPIDIRAGVIKATTGDPGQAHGESADCRLIANHAVRADQAVAAIDPHARAGIDQDVGDQRIGQQRLQRAGPQDLGGQLTARSQGTRLPQNDGLAIENLRNQPMRRGPARPDLGPHRG